MFLENKMVDERISRAIDNDHTAAMKANGDSRKHMRKKDGSSFSSEISVCMLCKKAFKNHIIYRRHLRIHSEKTFVCQICGKSFMYKNYLQSHMLTHSKHQQFPCHLCHKRFSQKCNLNQHLKFHSTKKPFKCNICDKDFFQQEHLKAHLRHHNNERPFECEICHKSFNIKSSLQRHMNCHTGEKPFICVICNRGYTRRSVLMLHIQQVHENKKPFQCDECQLCFSQKGNLQAHFRRKHLQPKSEHKRGKDKDGVRGKRGIKRQNPKSFKVCTNKSYNPMLSSDSDEPSKRKIKAKSDGSALHSYANKVKVILNGTMRKIEQFEKQKYGDSSPAESDTAPGVVLIKQEEPVSDSAQTTDLASTETDEYNSLSENPVDIMCSSSSCDSSDIPDLNIQNILDNTIDIPFDIKSLSGFDAIFDDCKGWDDYLLEDNVILNAALPQYDILSSPSKGNTILNKGSSDASMELFPNLSWTFGHDYACVPPLFGEDFDDKDIPINYSKNAVMQCTSDGKKKHEIKVQEKKKRDRLISKNPASRKPVNFNMHKMHLAGTSLQA